VADLDFDAIPAEALSKLLRETPPEELVLWGPEVIGHMQARLQRAHRDLHGRETMLKARPKQRPPDDPAHHLPWTHPDTGVTYQCDDPACQRGGTDSGWAVWLFCGGRGCGKTWTGSNWILSQALSRPGTTWGVCGPSYRDARSICFDNPKSGIVALGMRAGEIPEKDSYNKNNMKITLPNGSVIMLLSAEKPESVRGQSLDGVWFDELCSIDGAGEDFYEYALMPALREGDARMLITTTPARTRILRELHERARDPEFKIHVTRATIFENPVLSAHRVRQLEMQYKGTRLYKQELLGEMLDDVAGALFELDTINNHRVFRDDVPVSRNRVVVAIDPATTSREKSDESGIIVVAASGEDAYVLADRSKRGTPDEIMRTAVVAYYEFNADTIVCEQNSGGDYLDNALMHVDPNIRLTKVHAMRGKFIRAQPVSMLYEQGRVHHVFDRGKDGSRVNPLEKLEDELCAITRDGDRSRTHDDRADALVWAITELKGLSQASFKQVYGFMACESCSKDIHQKDIRCKHCGAEVRRESDPAAKGELTHWAAAYMSRCSKCGSDYPSGQTCPGCQVSADSYMRQVMRFTGQQPARRTVGLGGAWKRGGY
jgi:phage terminase large subunit-like protein